MASLNALSKIFSLKNAIFRMNIHRNSNINYLRPKQIDALTFLREKNDVLAVLPTGFGKSLIFEALPFMNNSPLVVIIEPLNAIIQEQISRCPQLYLHINETFIKTIQDLREVTPIVDESVRYFIGHPEQVLNKHFFKFLQLSKCEVSYICIDEAHCILMWGEEFRPKYKEISIMRSILPDATMVALTATATEDSSKELVKILKLKSCKIIRGSIDRNNIYIEIFKRTQPDTEHCSDRLSERSVECCVLPILEQFLKAANFERTIIYTSLKWIGHIQELAIKLNNGIIPQHMAQYHAPQTNQMKKEIADEMKRPNGKISLLLATQAYGMGADAPDVRHIVHIGVPKSLESYVQEIGRAGRDGKPARATLYYSATDLSSKYVSQDVKDFIKADMCRRSFLCTKFTCTKSEESSYRCCDNCEKDDLSRNIENKKPKPKLPKVGSYQHLAYETLIGYFNAENSSVEGGVISTGLTERVAREAVSLLADGLTIIKKETVIEKFSYLDEMLADNIFEILCHHFYGRDVED